MDWLDESRRTAFEHWNQTHSRAEGTAADVGDLETLLPDEIRAQGVAMGDEVMLCQGDALAVVRIASEHQIAVLGLEAGEVLNDGIQIVDYSAYDSHIPFTGDWAAYVATMNAAAKRWLEERPLGQNHGFILTSASQTEFVKLDMTMGNIGRNSAADLSKGLQK